MCYGKIDIAHSPWKVASKTENTAISWLIAAVENYYHHTFIVVITTYLHILHYLHIISTFKMHLVTLSCALQVILQ